MCVVATLFASTISNVDPRRSHLRQCRFHKIYESSARCQVVRDNLRQLQFWIVVAKNVRRESNGAPNAMPENSTHSYGVQCLRRLASRLDDAKNPPRPTKGKSNGKGLKSEEQRRDAGSGDANRIPVVLAHKNPTISNS